MFNNFYKGKKILITGHTGFKGAWLSIWLTKLGANIVGYALKPPTNPSMFELCNVDSKIKSIIGDIRDIDNLSKVIYDFKPEIIFHLAAQPLVRYGYENPVETFEVNVMGTVNLLDVVRRCSFVKAVINVTTDKCYENKESFWGYKETDKLGGYDPYSSSKSCSELITEAFKNSYFNEKKYFQHGVAIATVRAGNVIGGGDFAIDRLIPDFIRGIMANEKISIRNPKAIRPWQHILEPLSGYLELAKNLYIEGVKYNGAWNFGPTEDSEKDVKYIIDKLISIWEGKVFYEINEDEILHETSYLKLDSYKSRKLIGFRPKINIDEALKVTLDWTKEYLKNKDGLYDYTIFQISNYEMNYK